MRALPEEEAVSADTDELPAYSYVGRKPEPDHCDDCGDKTNHGSALCPICADNRYQDRLNEWWDKHPLGEAFDD
jgi:hypothetical protein